jgi:hypothetical protein
MGATTMDATTMDATTMDATRDATTTDGRRAARATKAGLATLTGRARRAVVSCGAWVRGWSRRVRAAGHDAGMATAEYAIVTLAAVGFAALLVTILRSDEVRAALLGIVRRALSAA